uniref:Putative secreted protein n=1 Tax=Anopheles triannulatus TaxID=58253 RepID=A0A2M4B509_9DIPT
MVVLLSTGGAGSLGVVGLPLLSPSTVTSCGDGVVASRDCSSLGGACCSCAKRPPSLSTGLTSIDLAAFRRSKSGDQ